MEPILNIFLWFLLSFPNILSALNYLQGSQVKLLGEVIMKTATQKKLCNFPIPCLQNFTELLGHS